MNETVNPQGNPQGKGLVMVLQQMAAAAPAEIRPKSADEAMLDYWCSSLVLSAAFKLLAADRTGLVPLLPGPFAGCSCFPGRTETL